MKYVDSCHLHDADGSAAFVAAAVAAGASTSSAAIRIDGGQVTSISREPAAAGPSPAIVVVMDVVASDAKFAAAVAVVAATRQNAYRPHYRTAFW